MSKSALCERFEQLHLVHGNEVVETVPTYRGEGKHSCSQATRSRARLGSTNGM